MMMSLTSCLCAQANDCMTFLIWDLSCYLCRQFQQQLGPGCSGVSNTASLVLCAIPMSNSFVQQFILDASPSYSSFFFSDFLSLRSHSSLPPAPAPRALAEAAQVFFPALCMGTVHWKDAGAFGEENCHDFKNGKREWDKVHVMLE